MASGYMFSHYWPGDGAPNGPPPTIGSPYSQWQSTIILSMGFFPIPSLPSNWWGRVKFIYKLVKFVMSPEFERAISIVKEVAVTPDMNNGKAWGEIGNYMAKQPGVGENVYRHLLACQKWGAENNGKSDRHIRDAFLTLAWLFHKKERS